jgi:DNA anti-recombination protein RmuC
VSKNDTYLYNIDTSKLEDVMSDTEENVEYLNKVAKEVADSYTRHLDTLMQNLYKRIIKPEDLTLDELEKNYLELTNLLYFLGDGLESLGVKAAMSKAAAKEVYNKAYLSNQIKDADRKNKTTVAELTATAESASQYESVVNAIYEHAYKTVQYKVDSASEMVRTLSKIITKRINEMNLSKGAYNG